MLAISVVLYIQFSGINYPNSNPSQNCVTITTICFQYFFIIPDRSSVHIKM